MATSIERNTDIILDRVMDSLFAQQEDMKKQAGIGNDGKEFGPGGKTESDTTATGLPLGPLPDAGYGLAPYAKQEIKAKDRFTAWRRSVPKDKTEDEWAFEQYGLNDKGKPMTARNLDSYLQDSDAWLQGNVPTRKIASLRKYPHGNTEFYDNLTTDQILQYMTESKRMNVKGEGAKRHPWNNPLAGFKDFFEPNASDMIRTNNQLLLDTILNQKDGRRIGDKKGSHDVPEAGKGLRVSRKQRGDAADSLMTGAGGINAKGQDLGLFGKIGQGFGNMWQNNFADGNWKGTTSNILQAAPGIGKLAYGLFGKQQKLDPNDFYNPNEDAALNELRKAEPYDISPDLANVTAERNIFNRNVRNSGAMNTGQLYGNYAAGQANATRATGQIHSGKRNIERGEEITRRGNVANMLASFGRDRAQTNFGIQQINDQNEAAKRGYAFQGLEDLSMMSQFNERQRGQERQAGQLASILPGMFPSSEHYQELLEMIEHYKNQS